MLNHLIMLGNVFPIEILVRILFLKIPYDYWKELKTFLIFLKYMPERVGSVNGKYDGLNLIFFFGPNICFTKYSKHPFNSANDTFSLMYIPSTW